MLKNRHRTTRTEVEQPCILRPRGRISCPRFASRARVIIDGAARVIGIAPGAFQRSRQPFYRLVDPPPSPASAHYPAQNLPPLHAPATAATSLAATSLAATSMSVAASALLRRPLS